MKLNVEHVETKEKSLFSLINILKNPYLSQYLYLNMEKNI